VRFLRVRERRNRTNLASLLVLLVAVGGPVAAADLVVSTSPPFFNPALGQVSTIRVASPDKAALFCEVLDRDGFVVRRLPPRETGEADATFSWDGRDDSGAVMPDEAYSVRLRRGAVDGVVVYDPAAGFVPTEKSISEITYSRPDGVLSYTLERSSRVHIQVGQATDSKGGEPQGPILRTLVDRQPRTAGAVIEKWSGFDESGQIYVPDLPQFVVAVFTTSLPENSMIAIGNRGGSFAEYALDRRPPAATSARAIPEQAHRLHHGLNALEDRSPRLAIASNAVLDAGRGLWQVAGKLRLTVTVEAAAAPYFLGQSTELDVFVDSRQVRSLKRPSNPVELSLEERDLPPGEHRIVVNWASKAGPVGVSAFKVSVAAKSAAQGSDQ
jgi:FlgD Ig-like domain